MTAVKCMVMTTKICHAEGCERPKVHGRGHLYCEQCAPVVKATVKRALNEAWLVANPHYNTPQETRRRRLFYRWGMTPEAFDALLASQDGRCANPGCRTDDPGRHGFHIDHDHNCCPPMKSCGKCIRGLLCGPCNRAAGYAHDDADVLRGLADYIAGVGRAQVVEQR